tara:strand:- start:378 stop:644 length:267 start_codon:yes stop_codon:yes gene_type:complete
MCSFGSGPSAPPPPPPPDPAIEEQAKAERARMRKMQQEDANKLKQQQFEDAVAAYQAGRGRRSLLTGSGGGRGFEVASGLMTKKTLGA